MTPATTRADVAVESGLGLDYPNGGNLGRQRQETQRRSIRCWGTLIASNEANVHAVLPCGKRPRVFAPWSISWVRFSSCVGMCTYFDASAILNGQPARPPTSKLASPGTQKFYGEHRCRRGGKESRNRATVTDFIQFARVKNSKGVSESVREI